MANVSNSNTDYVDTTGTLRSNPKNLKVACVVITATAANAVLVLTDTGSGNPTKADLRVPTSGSTQVFDFALNPLIFPNGVRVGTLTNAVATVVYN